MSLTRDFDANPLTWMMTHRYVSPAASYVGAPGALATGDGAFRFDDRMVFAGNGGCLLQVADWRSPIDRFSAFYLGAQPNQDNAAVLSNTSRRFLTADLSGCQFLAYGPDRNTLTVEHNNYFAGVGAGYAGRYGHIHGQGHAIFIALRPSTVPTAAADEYNILEGANIVGIRKADGWHFYARKQTDRRFGPTNEL